MMRSYLAFLLEPFYLLIAFFDLLLQRGLLLLVASYVGFG